MVAETRRRNKSAHPAAPVMTEAAKVKAGITPAKPRKKRTTKEARIRELEEEVARLRHPDDAHPSKEPLVSALPFNTHDPTLITLPSLLKTNPRATIQHPTLRATTAAQATNANIVLRTQGMSRLDSAPISTLTARPRNVKRTKSHPSLADNRPTVRNKPSGLVNTWYDIATTSSPQQSPPALHDYMFDPSYPASQPHVDDRAQFSLSPLSPLSQPQPVSSHVTEPLPQRLNAPADRFATPLPQRLRVASDPLMAASPSLPFTSHSTHDDPFWVPPAAPILRQDIAHYQLTTLPRPYAGGNGEKWTVGIQDLPSVIRVTFQGNYIRRIIRTVFSSTSPWINPPIETLQREFNAAYPNYQVKLHLDDAAVAPVLIPTLSLLDKDYLQQNTDSPRPRCPAFPDRERGSPSR